MQQSLWLRAARAWLQRRWLLCLFSVALLLLLGMAVLRSGAHEAYQSRESGRLPILASARCARYPIALDCSQGLGMRRTRAATVRRM